MSGYLISTEMCFIVDVLMVKVIRRPCGLAGAGGNKLGVYLTQLWRVI